LAIEHINFIMLGIVKALIREVLAVCGELECNWKVSYVVSLDVV
jgi:hypothetical protein